MKHEWRKHEKSLYLPKAKPIVVNVPPLKFFTIKGSVNPNDQAFGDYIAALYAVSYGVRMSYKWDNPPLDYYAYTVYPLEGIWDLIDHSKYSPTGVDKDNLSFELMIRQPDFVSPELAQMVLDKVKAKKPNPLLDEVIFKVLEDGPCIQMLHLGSYDKEAESFQLMTHFAKDNGYTRFSMAHREIYLTDARKTAPEKQKTVLRFMAKKED